MKKKFVYLLRTSEDTYKIGVTADIDKRIKSLQTGSSEPIVLVDKFLSSYPFKIESVLHRRFADSRISGEWFCLADEDVKSFRESCMLLEKNFKILDVMENPFF